VSQKQVFV